MGMRKLAVVVFIGALLSPSPAVASAKHKDAKAQASQYSCWCVYASKSFAKYPAVRARFRAEMSKRFMPPVLTKREGDRIVKYAGWGKVDDKKEGWCKRFPKTCKALAACFAFGTPAFAAAKFAGKSDKQAGKEFATYCAIGVATVIWTA